jgi:hypothetical protein
MWQMSLFDQHEVGNRDNIIAKAEKLIDLYHAGELGGTSHEVYPTLDRGSAENYLYFTLAPALNFQRKSEGLWRAALRTFNDPETNFVFQPAKVSVSHETEVQAALTKHSLALQRSKHTHIWMALCKTFYKNYQGDPRELLKRCEYDVVKVLELLNSKKAWFPYLSGPKLSNYWLYILTYFTDVKLANRQEISIIPDLHVVRATQHLGLVSPEDATPEKVAEVWKTTLRGTDISPSDLHAPLWRWSRKGFWPEL